MTLLDFSHELLEPRFFTFYDTLDLHQPLELRLGFNVRSESLPSLRSLDIYIYQLPNQLSLYSYKSSPAPKHNSDSPVICKKSPSSPVPADDSNESSSTSRRRRITSQQRATLDRAFQHAFFPSTELRNQLASQLQLSPRTVQIWFQNRRQAWRAKNRPSSHHPMKNALARALASLKSDKQIALSHRTN